MYVRKCPRLCFIIINDIIYIYVFLLFFFINMTFFFFLYLFISNILNEIEGVSEETFNKKSFSFLCMFIILLIIT